MDTLGYRSEFVQKLDATDESEHAHASRRTEWKTAVYGLCLSMSVILAKVFHAKRDVLHHYFFEKQLISYETIEKNGEIMMHYVWATVWRSHNVLLPVVCGALMTLFTWIMVYLDSSVPGVQPPSPLSPSKYKARSRHTFHMGYVIAIVNGLLVTVLMFINGITL